MVSASFGRLKTSFYCYFKKLSIFWSLGPSGQVRLYGARIHRTNAILMYIHTERHTRSIRYCKHGTYTGETQHTYDSRTPNNAGAFPLLAGPSHMPVRKKEDGYFLSSEKKEREKEKNV